MGGIVAGKENTTTGDLDSFLIFNTRNNATGNNTERVRITSGGYVGIGKTPAYQLELSSDSAGKPGAGGTWTVVSDERIKKDIQLADLDRCYEIIKEVPLKYFGWADGIYSEAQVKDRHNLGWIAQDVQKVFPQAVSSKLFTKYEKIPDGYDEYEEQDVEIIETEEDVIEVVDGKAVKTRQTTEKAIPLFDEYEVVDNNNTPVVQEIRTTEGIKTAPVIHKVPRMVKKLVPKFRQDTIDNCLDLNSGQLIAAMYGAVQKLIEKVEALEQAKSSM